MNDKALVKGLREEADEWDEPKSEDEVDMRGMLHRAADRIEQLEREKAVVSGLWEQQKEIALGYLADCNALSTENERLREAGGNLNWYAGHTEDCGNGSWSEPIECDCGYTDAWKQWGAALGETK